LISEMAISESYAGEFRRSVESWGKGRERNDARHTGNLGRTAQASPVRIADDRSAARLVVGGLRPPRSVIMHGC